MKTIVIATKNLGKAREYAEMLEPVGIQIRTLADFPEFSINENGQTFEQNAFIKAQTAVKKLGLPVLADDSGLMVDYLQGAPGVHSARYAGDHDDLANNQKLLRELAGVDDLYRTAHFHTTIVGLKPNGAKLVAHGRVDGHILRNPQGENGFGYDPLFYVDELGCAMATLTDEQKNAVSHRGRALTAFMKNFNDWWLQ
ncbi:MAG TPA: XTP/dITP diphosphatase [Candidatus Limosilactobacillus excrementigallinarum]|nr:XTP/dITP diphosphatase [Candidatus Limosilactobacillus excrementigallinarum]